MLTLFCKNTKSDLGPVNPLFNRLLKTFCEDLLPKVVENWDGLDIEKRDIFIDRNFSCKLLLLANFASETDKILKDFESAMVNDSFENKFAFNSKE